MNIIKIGTRKSLLACVQAELVCRYMQEHCPGYEARLVKMTTMGDRMLSRRLDEIGGKGVFVRELDQALAEGRTDLSVHSLKDMPAAENPALPVIGCSRREDARDVLVLPKGVTEYDGRSPVGTSSNRRGLQFKALYPEAEIRSVRGNVITRLEKLDRGEYGALVLAAAGLKRLGLEERISRYFSVDQMVPAAGQGIVCVQSRAGEDYGFLEGFFCREAEDCAAAEKAYMAYLNGGCALPAGVYAEIGKDGRMTVRGMYYDEKTGECRKMQVTGERSRARELGAELAGAITRNTEDF